MQPYPKLPEYLLNLCRDLRKNQTDVEKILWECLRNRRLHGVKFRRQFPIDRYVVDFYAFEPRLVIEVDGEIHDYQKEQDEFRSGIIESYDLVILRFRNERVLADLGGVLEEISQTLADLYANKLHKPFPPLPLVERAGFPTRSNR